MKFILSFIVAVLVSTMASAVPITFVYTGTLSTGTTLGGDDVGDQSFVFTATGDTDNAVPGEFGAAIELPHDTAVISIDGGAEFTVTTPTQTFSNTALDVIGLGSPAIFDIFGIFLQVDYDFTTDVAQTTNPDASFFNIPQALDTSGGSLVISQPGSAPGTFQATLGVAEIPLPPTLLLSLAAFGLLSIASRRARQEG